MLTNYVRVGSIDAPHEVTVRGRSRLRGCRVWAVTSQAASTGFWCQLRSPVRSVREPNRGDNIFREAVSDDEPSLAGQCQAALVRRVRGIPASLSTAAGTPASRQAL